MFHLGMGEMGKKLVFSHQKDCRHRGMMGVRVMEWQSAVTNTERQAEKGERREEEGM